MKIVADYGPVNEAEADPDPESGPDAEIVPQQEPDSNFIPPKPTTLPEWVDQIEERMNRGEHGSGEIEFQRFLIENDIPFRMESKSAPYDWSVIGFLCFLIVECNGQEKRLTIGVTKSRIEDHLTPKA